MTSQPHTHAEDPNRACAACAMERARELERAAVVPDWGLSPAQQDALAMAHEDPDGGMARTLFEALGYRIHAVLPVDADAERIVADMMKRRPRKGARRAL